MIRDITFRRNLNDFIIVHKSAAKWRSQNSPIYSRVWDPNVYDRSVYLEEFYEDQAFCMYINDALVGAVVLYPEGASKFKKKAVDVDESALYLEDLAVMSEYIGEGWAGAELVEQVVIYARDNGFKKIRLDSDARQTKLIEFYKRSGFEVSREAYDEHEDRTSMFMERKILNQ